jgi:hypothetical protein
MKAKRESRTELRRGVVLTLVAAVILAAPLAGQAKKGATVLVTMKAGEQVEGELIAVKPASLLLLSSSGQDRSIDTAEVFSVTVVRRSKAGQGAMLGLTIGAVGGFAGGAIYAKAAHLCPGCEAPMARAGMGVLGGLAGVVGGLIAGVSAGRDLNLALDSPDSPSFATSLQKLKKYARVQDPR